MAFGIKFIVGIILLIIYTVGVLLVYMFYKKSSNKSWEEIDDTNQTDLKDTPHSLKESRDFKRMKRFKGIKVDYPNKRETSVFDYIKYMTEIMPNEYESKIYILAYYIQALSLALNGEKAYSEKAFLNNDYLIDFDNNTRKEPKMLSTTEVLLADRVIEKFGGMSLSELFIMFHKENPFQIVFNKCSFSSENHKQYIPIENMKEYYSTHYKF